MLYLAYGSNLNMEQMYHRCPHSVAMGTAVLNNHKLVFKGYSEGFSYLTVEPCESSSVPLGVWHITAQDERYLDTYEGYPHSYYKAYPKVDITTFNGQVYKKTPALIYIMTSGRDIYKPSIYYKTTCLDGYMDFDFDTNILYEALNEAGGAVHRPLRLFS